MNYVIDTNIILSALIKDSVTRKIILEFNLNLYYPEISFKEIQKHKKLVLKKSGIKEKEYNLILNNLINNIILVPKNKFENFLNKANSLIGKTDVDDVPFLACALSLDSEIWSDDKHFQKQKKIKILTTREFVKRLLKVSD